ncbi:MAG: glycosyltransferase family 2 protein [Nanoarchaeota archaeon]
MPDPELSFVIPVYNEEENIPQLYRELTDVMKSVKRTYELIFIDDGSNDRSMRVIKELASRDPRVQYLSFRRNFGKSRALAEGFPCSRGSVIFTMDGDLQDDPREIPKFLAKMDEGYELVSGWKQRRQDPLGKTLPSKFFNWLTGRMTGIKLHDFNCGFKCYTRDAAMSLDIYGELHRYLPAIAHWKGFKVTEIPIHHRPRVAGKSKFGVSRLLKGFLDLFTVKFLMAFREKPAHAFSSLGMLMFLAGFIAGSYLAYENLVYKAPIVRPLLFFVVLAIIVGIQLVSFGFISELIAYNSRKDLGSGVKEKSR